MRTEMRAVTKKMALCTEDAMRDIRRVLFSGRLPGAEKNKLLQLTFVTSIKMRVAFPREYWDQPAPQVDVGFQDDLVLCALATAALALRIARKFVK